MKDEIWVEKYRPKTFDDLIFENKDRLKKFIKDKNALFPHLLLHSKSGGTGKGSIFNVLSNELNCNIKIVNASEHTGVDYMRDVIQNYVSTMSFFGDTRKIIFLDEADGMSISAFNSLKGLIEKYSDNAIFILSTNNINKIIGPIRSRCYEIDLKLPNRDEILKRLKHICKLENVEYEEGSLNKIITINYPDIRSMVKHLQMFSVNGKEKITIEKVRKTDSKSEIVFGMMMKGIPRLKAREYWLEENLDLVKLFKDFWLIYNAFYVEKFNNDKKILNVFEHMSNNISSSAIQDVSFNWFYVKLQEFCLI